MEDYWIGGIIFFAGPTAQAASTLVNEEHDLNSIMPKKWYQVTSACPSGWVSVTGNGPLDGIVN
jgi:hypothetical protein